VDAGGGPVIVDDEPQSVVEGGEKPHAGPAVSPTTAAAGPRVMDGLASTPTTAAAEDATAESPPAVPAPLVDTPAPTTPTTFTAAAPVGEPTADTVTVTCCDWGLGAPYREVVHGGRASQWTIAPRGDITLRLYSPPNQPATYSVHISADSVTPEPPRNIIGGWTVSIAPGTLVTLHVRNLTALQMDDCFVEGCRLEFFES
jgi:hypothetical protein